MGGGKTLFTGTVVGGVQEKSKRNKTSNLRGRRDGSVVKST